MYIKKYMQYVHDLRVICIYQLPFDCQNRAQKNTQTWLPREIAHSICQALFPRPGGVLLTNVEGESPQPPPPAV